MNIGLKCVFIYTNSSIQDNVVKDIYNQGGSPKVDNIEGLASGITLKGIRKFYLRNKGNKINHIFKRIIGTHEGCQKINGSWINWIKVFQSLFSTFEIGHFNIKKQFQELW